MREKIKKRLKPILFAAGGALAGLAYYFVGCKAGACPLTASPWITMAYVGLAGWVLSGVFGKECSDSCNTR